MSEILIKFWHFIFNISCIWIQYSSVLLFDADVVGHLGVLCMLQEYKNSVRTYPFSRGYKLILLAQFAIIMLFLKSDRSDDKPGNN